MIVCTIILDAAGTFMNRHCQSSSLITNLTPATPAFDSGCFG